MFLALFLTPWVVMYALSTLGMHHREFFTGSLQRIEPEFETIHEIPYSPTFGDSADAEEAGQEILQHLGLEGAHSVRGKPGDDRITVTRHRAIGTYRITYTADPGTLKVERQGFGLAYFLEMLHRRRSYEQPYWANTMWAVLVDCVIVAIVLWAITGLWMWLEMKRTRRLGSLCLFVGVGGFVLFLATL